MCKFVKLLTVATATIWMNFGLAIGQGQNVALNKPASQLLDLDYLFLWTADKGVDGCTLQNNPDVQRCCSATMGTTNNFWRVDLLQQYMVDRIVVYGRSDQSDQLQDFIVYVQADVGYPDVPVYDNTGLEYGNGIFNITLSPAKPVRAVKLMRPAGDIMTICEVQVFEAESGPLNAFLKKTGTNMTQVAPAGYTQHVP